MNLNPQQLEAVHHTEGPLLIVAGAGSGKTRVITHRIAHLIQQHRVPPWNILAVTFTNKAAGEMKERVEHLLHLPTQGQSARGLWISTFHSACLRILRQSLEALGYAKDFVIYDDDEQQTLLKQCLKEFDFNDETIENACRNKLSEVEERLQYVEIYLPQSLENTRKELEYAYKDRDEENFELCLSKASKAKANVDTVLSVFGVRNEDVARVVDKKLEIVERSLVEETEKGVFPIVGYSYFEYANSLKEDDPFSALLYSEYALELSNLDIYFKTQKAEKFTLFDNVDKKLLGVLVIGIILGMAIGKIAKLCSKKSRKKRA